MPLPEWEETTEKRLGILEMKMDKILDPETGLYPKLNEIASSLKTWAITILTSIVLLCIAVIVSGLVHG